ncbi:prepilin-type N-terminal cleavage/methylation domain-containing protein [Verminephrobacter aporrectodeae subsp. tuberculatae]|uniref:Prepilin-type N-terminal cleavage/methylation domain-containing protein n=1 Tax=Verminephrobacter aporrectodeae subsp. tuberculatae TaxID=1110392 RepID=A0ABT3KR91_9BURK|nr:type IV pilin protein [Verminephrobacter aporrectodeae]MCW5220234.1 prepilin-type N-terminal cleavage/methylation domain-containing protein [Verminephrobacter aporrectodeae subsp. tuberculatae]MCW5255794.1 prepilin-type N-terminal cleavage/methylation domain-containing protein [Verminephrobacter aporrectodeae subsp. tuberculatae]MCW5289527.1 prepilin-type N-terminal cleavage/methylation domain-containing protein [Verminephrobacter aporrectodeae subsp. tuberculatae]MCW5320816.1 prepilin-type 
MNHKRTQRGFTLIEVMIVTAIIAILAAVAYPSYREYIAKSRRAEAKTILISAQQWMERFYTENFRYDENSAGVAVSDPSQFPSRFSVSPVPGQGSPVYKISLDTSIKRDEYSVKADRLAGSVMANDRCGDFSIDHLGRKDLKNYSGFADKSAAMEACWK